MRDMTKALEHARAKLGEKRFAELERKALRGLHKPSPLVLKKLEEVRQGIERLQAEFDRRDRLAAIAKAVRDAQA